MPHFQLVTVDGDVLGARELNRSDWPVGSVIHARPSGPSFRVVRELDNDDPEMHFTVLVVEPVG